MPEGNQKIAVIRIRGKVHVRCDIEDTLSMLNLTRKNHCVLLSKTPEYAGMLRKVNDHVTWGEVKTETILKLLQERGKLTDKEVKENSKFNSIKEFADALASGKAGFKDVTGLKPVFTLSPPHGGFERGGIKKPYGRGGVLGYRGDKISELIERML